LQLGIPCLLRRTVRTGSAQNRHAEQKARETHAATIASLPAAVHGTCVLA
jgi:hypothetical protein